ncbi:uncharacterized protein RCC_05355 [Ramularia collo-cygni]|uniref:Uncharacterized protein n=1 Tax=Ramularia collo-cygni TaxID=112498 RepID=A0A2D3VA37_9PEZI|nr:uncharacterized protein RCC_05355 [Ramularia collo-cygni]CZT19504.1 uncharacterized protein RCC_05355 [Ramularia collo-cygni]
MSLVRAFTTRRSKTEDIQDSVYVGRAASHRGGKPVHRSQISAPVALVSTTNPLSYDAPDIAGTFPIAVRSASPTLSPVSRSSEGDDSDASTLSIDTNTDASSVGDSPLTSPELEPNHLSCYFKPAVNTATPDHSPRSSTRASVDAPSIPQRVPSHSKRAHEKLHRKRSVMRLMSPPASIVRHSTEIFSPQQEVETDSPRDSHPFSSELAKLDEAVEDITHVVRDVEDVEDADAMSKHGLARFDAAAYLEEIHAFVEEAQQAEQPTWF